MNDKNPIEDLREIRKMMESSSKFISLSGLSGVFAGVVALISAYIANGQISKYEKLWYYFSVQGRLEEGIRELGFRLFFLAICTFVLAVLGALFFTGLKARKQQKKLWTKLTIRMLISLAIPLFFGGLFTIAIYLRGYIDLVAPSTLIFYGMALLNAAKYVHTEIKYLGICQMILGILAVFFPFRGIEFWAIGFGGLHIIYGLLMYFKYDRKQNSFE